MKVDFVVAGTQKGGTSAIDHYLRLNQDIRMASKKEVHFFDNEANFGSNPDYTEYHSFFDENVKDKMLGEVTPVYMYWNEAPRRIWEYNSQMKLIIILRNPIERAYSHWNMERVREMESLPFLEAIENEGNRCRGALPFQHRIFSYIDRGFYSKQLKRIWRYFPKEQTLVINYQNLKKDLYFVLSEIASFLEINDFPSIQLKQVHTIPYISQMTKSEYDYLRNVFYNEIKELEVVLGWDCSDWLKE